MVVVQIQVFEISNDTPAMIHEDDILYVTINKVEGYRVKTKEGMYFNFPTAKFFMGHIPFVQVDRNLLVNKNNVVSIEGATMKLTNGEELKGSHSKQVQIKEPLCR